ncbi:MULTISPECIES: YqjF family protein [unclassified Nocardiopsis]|uniref:YqjF family protein n=1 Tax=Nocardiopsis TaxID=2013 RepID=UPI00387A8E25
MRGGGRRGAAAEVPELPPESPRVRPRPVLLRQRWSDVVFLHWPVDPAQVAPLLPAGTRPDLLGGVAHAGLVAFRMPVNAAAGVPLGGFDEVNVRVYSVDRHGRRGVVFLSMDADAAHAVVAARALTGLPYMWSDISLVRGREGVRAGAVRRRAPGGARGRWAVRAGEPLEHPGPLEHFLTARWGLHTRHLGRTWWLRADHRPWPLHRAEFLHYEGDLLGAAGLTPLTERPVSALWSPGTDTGFTVSLV